MKRQIVFWHGRTDKLENKVKEFCSEEKGNYYWEGSLDLFAEHFPRFMVLDEHGIAITQHNSFSAR